MSTIAVFLSLLIASLAHPHSDTLVEKQAELDDRIVGGTVTTIQKFPFMVSLRENFDNEYESHICGGSIISENFVLTAGHCCQDENVKSLVTRVGKTDMDKGEKHEVSTMILHPKYYKLDNVAYNDVCLLKVSTPFVYNDSIKAITLAKENSEVPDGALATVSGWGALSYEGDVMEALREVEIPIVSHALCVREYGLNQQGYKYVNDTMICAGYQQGGKDACQGDSGGPLTVGGVQVGIVSWGAGCAQPKYPGVFTKVAYFRDWIKSESGV